ncbi:winged helix-turn-helix domain-containing protein [Kitasatospora sp. NPDC059646]|uniref:winged helix-turn-helix domain-containing protein n=1 Tax=Kitasatospora sp. NPDC059646 TaxID=3346893 RepID=UPI00369FD4EC
MDDQHLAAGAKTPAAASEGLDSQCALLLLSLTEAGPTGHTTRAALASSCGLSLRRVNHHIRHLIETGQVEMLAESGTGTGSGMRLAARYALPR